MCLLGQAWLPNRPIVASVGVHTTAGNPTFLLRLQGEYHGDHLSLIPVCNDFVVL